MHLSGQLPRVVFFCRVYAVSYFFFGDDTLANRKQEKLLGVERRTPNCHPCASLNIWVPPHDKHPYSNYHPFFFLYYRENKLSIRFNLSNLQKEKIVP